MVTVLGLPEPVALALLGAAMLFAARSARRVRLMAAAGRNWRAIRALLSCKVAEVSKKSLAEMTSSVPASQIQ